jgi:hypothetical protein
MDVRRKNQLLSNNVRVEGYPPDLKRVMAHAPVSLHCFPRRRITLV